MRDSAVGIATRYELGGPGPNPGRSEIFRTRPDWPRTHPAFYTMGTESFSQVLVRAVNHSPPSSSEVKQRVELYHYFLPGPSWSLLGQILLYLYLLYTLRSDEKTLMTFEMILRKIFGPVIEHNQWKIRTNTGREKLHKNVRSIIKQQGIK